MKKIILFGLMIIGLTACKKSNDDIERPDERLTKTLNAYQKQLQEAENGWIGYLFPKGGGGYTFKFKFDDKNRVVTYSDMMEDMATTPKESSYRLKAVQLPTLYFDTYSYLHMLADPDESVLGGTRGEGFNSDFEFAFLSSSADTIKMKGNLNGSTLMLVRAKADEGDDYIAKTYANNEALSEINKFQYYYKELTLGGKNYNITINADRHSVSFNYEDGGFKTFTTEFASSPTGIVLREPFIQGDVKIAEFHDFDINVAAGTIKTVSGTTPLTITGVATPVAIDKRAAAKMYTTSYDYTSDYGFTMAGVENAFNVTAIPGYVGMQFVANAYSNPLDALFFYFNGGAVRYGPVFNTRLDADGKMVIVKSGIGNQGSNPGAASVIIVNNVYNQLADPAGYYVFEVGVNSYDLVSVSNSKNWIRFY